ncbi:MAG: hypothetical protein NTY15_01735 [Planctomycetota bacterium]|nr:hypothetical protein [Planctomycetota bacterium]
MIGSIRVMIVLSAVCCAIFARKADAQLEFTGSDGVAYTATIKTQTSNTNTVNGSTIIWIEDGYGTYPFEVKYSYTANSAPSIVSVAPVLDSWFGGLDYIYLVLDSTSIVNTGTSLDLQVSPDSNLNAGQEVTFSEFKRYSFRIKMQYHYVCPIGLMSYSFGATTLNTDLEGGLLSRSGTATVD